MSFDTKIKVILLDGLEPWQELNVTAFLMSGIAQSGEITGEPYEDADGVRYLPMSQQPIVILTADSEKLKEVMQKATARGMEVAIYTKELFTTFNDEDNRAAVKRFKTDELDLAGIAIRGLRNQLDRITKGLETGPPSRAEVRFYTISRFYLPVVFLFRMPPNAHTAADSIKMIQRAVWRLSPVFGLFESGFAVVPVAGITAFSTYPHLEQVCSFSPFSAAVGCFVTTQSPNVHSSVSLYLQTVQVCVWLPVWIQGPNEWPLNGIAVPIFSTSPHSAQTVLPV